MSVIAVHEFFRSRSFAVFCPGHGVDAFKIVERLAASANKVYGCIPFIAFGAYRIFGGVKTYHVGFEFISVKFDGRAGFILNGHGVFQSFTVVNGGSLRESHFASVQYGRIIYSVYSNIGFDGGDVISGINSYKIVENHPETVRSVTKIEQKSVFLGKLTFGKFQTCLNLLSREYHNILSCGYGESSVGKTEFVTFGRVYCKLYLFVF